MKRWLTGCGIGCLLVVVVAVVGGSIAFRKIKDTVSEFENVGESQERLVDAFGGVEDFTPPADGRIGADRLEMFLSIQETLAPVGAELETSLADLRSLEDGEGFSFGKVRAAFRGIGAGFTNVGRYMQQRNDALLDEGMGFGEFTWLQSVIYYGWLGEPLVLTLDGDDDGETRRRRRNVHGVLKGFLQRQREAALVAGDPGGIVEAIETELAEMVIDDERVPWTDGLPPAILDSLSPYRGRLEAVYTDAGVLLGVGAEKDGEGFHFEVE